MVERNNDFGVQRFRHAQHVGAGHFIRNTARVLAVGAQSHVNLMLVTVLSVVVGVVGVTAVIQGAARRFEQVVHRALVHAVWQYTCRFLIGRQRNQSGTVKGIKSMDFNVFDFHHVARFHHDAALFRHTPANPEIHAGLRPDKRHIVRAVLHHRCRHVYINMVVVIVGREHGIDLTNGKRIKHKRCSTQVRLEFFNAGHTLHLVAFFHQRVTVALFAGAAPEIDADIGATF